MLLIDSVDVLSLSGREHVVVSAVTNTKLNITVNTPDMCLINP